ncbi:MAG: PD-(D/E)XK nuclease family protein [Anaerolineales bacterium]|nr:PD-(D/E)XK nuclease family protein [Anaerolineales bacterium]MDW8445803.1 PD-(D/E)XK nuclease family protein [Anaerolineales bacterium]
MPDLPFDFIFSQANLQDFLICPRRFYLRYIRRLAWPSAAGGEAFEWERRLTLAQDFHHLAHQKALGIADELLEPFVREHSAELFDWWTQLGRFWQTEQEGILLGKRYSELVLTAALDNARLIAKYDLLVAHPDGRWSIVDWKTTRQKPAPSAIKALIQSRLYPYLLVRAGTSLNEGAAIEPEQVRMVYWFANDPDRPETLFYSRAQFQADEDYLSHLMAEILGRQETEFELTADERACAYCPYRTYCERAFLAPEEYDVETGIELLRLSLPQDWEEVGEIEY